MTRKASTPFIIGGAILAGLFGAALFMPKEPATTKPTTQPAQAVLVVTSLADYAPSAVPIKGTLRDALANAVSGSSIRFAVSGDIDLAAPLPVLMSGLSIDGNGVTIRKNQVTIQANYVTLRNLRIRAGDGYISDAAAVEALGGFWGTRSVAIIDSENVLLENCSIQNSTDDNLSITGCKNITARLCIFSGGKRPPAAAMLAHDGNDPGWLTIDRCLFAECYGRMPDIGGGVCQFVNNVVIGPTAPGRWSNAKANIVGNWFQTLRPHPWTTPDRMIVADPTKLLPAGIFVGGNYLDGQAAKKEQLCGLVNRGQVDWPATAFATRLWPGMWRETLSPRAALATVLDSAGCLPRDKHDEQLVDRVRARLQ